MKYGSDKPDTRFGLKVMQTIQLFIPSPISYQLQDIGSVLDHAGLKDETVECLILRRDAHANFMRASDLCKSVSEENLVRFIFGRHVKDLIILLLGRNSYQIRHN